MIDSTGLKVYGEWKARKHGASKCRTWRKFHIALDSKTGGIVVEQLAGNDIQKTQASIRCQAINRFTQPGGPTFQWN